MKIHLGKYYVYAHYVDGVCVLIGKGSKFRLFDARTRPPLWLDNVWRNSKCILEIRILKEFDTSKEAYAFERKKIEEVKPLYNRAFNGYVDSMETRMKKAEARLSKKHTPESIAKMKLLHKGQVSSMKGRHHSEEARNKIREANKGQVPWILGKHHSKETRKKISDAHKGKATRGRGWHHSPETREKIRKALRRRGKGNGHS